MSKAQRLYSKKQKKNQLQSFYIMKGRVGSGQVMCIVWGGGRLKCIQENLEGMSQLGDTCGHDENLLGFTFRYQFMHLLIKNTFTVHI